MDEKDYTLIFCRRQSDEKGKQILLGLKKRGFGVGKWNGFGGKLEIGESIEDCAKRELEEECGLIMNSFDKVGYLVFKLLDINKLMRVHVFESFDFNGDLIDSEEMQPKWFNEDEIPYAKMWKDDSYWLKQFLETSKKFIGRFDYEDEDTIVSFSLNEH